MIVNQVNMSQVGTINTPAYSLYADAFQNTLGIDPRGPEIYTTAWGGYPEDRKTFYRWLRDNQILDNDFRISELRIKTTKCAICLDNTAKLCANCSNDILKCSRIELDYTYRMCRDMQKTLEKRIRQYHDKKHRLCISAKLAAVKSRVEQKREMVQEKKARIAELRKLTNTFGESIQIDDSKVISSLATVDQMSFDLSKLKSETDMKT